MDLPRLLFVNEAFFPHEGGAERRSYETLKRLSKKGFEVKVLTNSFNGEEPFSDFDVEYISKMSEAEYFNNSSRKIGGVLKFTSRVRKKLREYSDYDIYSFDEFPILHALKGYKVIRKNASKFFTWHEVLKDFYLQKGGLWRFAAGWEKQVSELSDNNIAVSNAIYQLLLHKYGKKNVTVVENGVNISDYVCSGQKKEWGKIVYVGRIEPHKQLDRLVKEVAKHKNFSIDIIGSGSQLPALKSMVNGSSNISILGHLPKDELVDRMKKAWMFIMPSYREGFSIASLEAMAASVPVITTRSEFNFAANEIIKDGKNGVVVDSFPQMFESMNNLYSNEEQWKQLSETAQDFSKLYDWNIIADKLAKLYITAWS